MDSRVASAIAKAEGMGKINSAEAPLKQRAQALEATSHTNRLASLSKPVPVMNTQNTDYPPMPNLAALPLKVRERSRHTPWPVKEQNMEVSKLPETRNVGKLFRRYNNGTLCYDDIIPKMKRIIQRHNEGLALMNETDCMMLSAVFPDVRFRFIEEEDIDCKAPLTERERQKIKRRLPICPVR